MRRRCSQDGTPRHGPTSDVGGARLQNACPHCGDDRRATSHVCLHVRHIYILWLIFFYYCSRFQHIHSLGMVHRSVKPENFGIRIAPPKTTVYLIDFHRSKMVECAWKPRTDLLCLCACLFTFLFGDPIGKTFYKDPNAKMFGGHLSRNIQVCHFFLEKMCVSHVWFFFVFCFAGKDPIKECQRTRCSRILGNCEVLVPRGG